MPRTVSSQQLVREAGLDSVGADDMEGQGQGAGAGGLSSMSRVLGPVSHLASLMASTMKNREGRGQVAEEIMACGI